MNFSVLPPEINSALIFAGAGPEPMAAAATAWDGLAMELASAAASFGSVTSGLVGGAWQGASSSAMAAAAAPYAAWLAAAAVQAEQTAAQAAAMIAEFEAVKTAVVQPMLVAANRADLVSLVMSNLFGQNAPAIAAIEALPMCRRCLPTMPGHRRSPRRCPRSVNRCRTWLACRLGWPAARLRPP